MGIGSTVAGMLPTQSQVSNVVQPAVQQAQSTPQPMGGKGGIVSRLGASAGNALGKTYGAQEPTTPQPMGGKGGMAAEPGVLRPAVMDQYTRPFQDMRPAVMPYQPSMPRFTDLAPDFMSPRGATTGGPRTLPASQQPQFDDKTTQAEFDRTRGITPAEQPMRPMNPYVSMDRFGGGFNPYAGGFNRGFNPYAGGYGGGFNPYAGGYGGGYGGGFGGGLGGLAALLQNRGMFYNEGGEVK